MTGGQDAAGALDVPELTRKLLAEGVQAIIVCRRRARALPTSCPCSTGVAPWHRDRLDEAQRELRETPGVTVLIYDQHCAAEARRLRKRGTLPVRTTRVVINEAVCEGCGDCGVKSNCLSVQPVETEFGRKTRIDQTSCNTDYSCLDGDCPSFVTVECDRVGTHAASRRRSRPPVPDPPPPAPDGTCDVLPRRHRRHRHRHGQPGAGDRGAPRRVRGAALDQTGLSQKAGPVISHLRLARDAPRAREPASGTAGALLPGASTCSPAPTREPRATRDPERTAAVVSTSRVPTGADGRRLTAWLPRRCRTCSRGSARSTRVPFHARRAAAAEALFGDTTPGQLPAGRAAPTSPAPCRSAPRRSSEAIELNGVGGGGERRRVPLGPRRRRRPGRVPRAVAREDAPSRPVDPLPGQPARRCDTGGRGGTGAAARRLRRPRARPLVRGRGRGGVGGRAARHRPYRLQRGRRRGACTSSLAYKDEYEVARLLTDPVPRLDRRGAPGRPTCPPASSTHRSCARSV